MMKSLENIINKNKYISKANNDKMKILKCRGVQKNCQIFENTKFYNLRTKQQRSCKIVLHNIYHSVNLELKKELLTLDKVINIYI